MASQPKLNGQALTPHLLQCHLTSTVVLAVAQTTFLVCALPPSSSSSSVPQPVLCSQSWPGVRPGFMFQSPLSSQLISFPSTNSFFDCPLALPSTLDLVSLFVVSCPPLLQKHSVHTQIGTSFIHLLSPALDELGSPCLSEAWSEYVSLWLSIEHVDSRWSGSALRTGTLPSQHILNIYNRAHRFPVGNSKVGQARIASRFVCPRISIS